MARKSTSHGELSDAISFKPHYLEHRSRLQERLLKGGAENLPDYEILEIHILPLQTDQFSPTKSSKRVELRAAVRRGSGNFSNNAVISYESVHPVLATAWHFDVLS